MSATRPHRQLPAPVAVSRALAVLLAIAAVAIGMDEIAVADPAQDLEGLAGRIAVVDDELAELAEAFAVLDDREAEVRRRLERANSQVERLTERFAATKALHRTHLDLSHRRTTVEQVDGALDALAVRSGVLVPDPERGVTWPEEASTVDVAVDVTEDVTGDVAVGVAVADGTAPAATSASLRTSSPTTPPAGHLRLRYAVRSSRLFTTLHLQREEAEQSAGVPRHELDTEVAPARDRLQDRLQELLAERTKLADSLAFERSLLERADHLRSPVTAAHRVSSRFGMRRHPVHGDVRMHTGLDLAAPIGTPVAAAAAGRVVAAGSRGGYGLTVDIEHGEGLLTRYAHLDRIDVARGDRLVAGQQLGTVGMTGTVTGPHLHLEVREHGQAVDPADWLQETGLGS